MVADAGSAVARRCDFDPLSVPDQTAWIDRQDAGKAAATTVDTEDRWSGGSAVQTVED